MCTAELARSNLFLSSELKKIIAGKKFSDDEEVLGEAGDYFEAHIVCDDFFVYNSVVLLSESLSKLKHFRFLFFIMISFPLYWLFKKYFASKNEIKVDMR